jgi:hypothetical protein
MSDDDDGEDDEEEESCEMSLFLSPLLLIF